MSHHEHTHDHDHDHHHHDHAPGETLPFDQKMIKLVTHWIRHNDDHEANYRDWAMKAAGAGLSDVAAELERAAKITGDTTTAFKRALALLSDHP